MRCPALLLLLLAGVSDAQLPPFAHEHAQERARQRLSAAVRKGFRAPSVPSELDYRDLSMRITLNPSTGVVSATATIKLASKTQPLDQLGFLIDSGLTVSAATINGAPAFITSTALGPTYNHVTLQPGMSLPANLEATAELSYAGTLRCLPYTAGDSAECILGPLGFFNDGSIFPMLIDSVSGFGGHDAFTRGLDLTVASGTRLVVSADPISSMDTGTELKTVWRTNVPLSRVLRFYLLTGALTSAPIASSPPSTLFTAPTGAAYASRLIAWTPVAFEAMEAVTGRKLPVTNLSAVLIPSSSAFIGSASYAITMLNEGYANGGDAYFEEIWGHEHIHQWWGVRATPSDYENSKLLTEGITTLLQYDAVARRVAPADPDLAMARKMRETQLLLRYRYPAAASLPLWLADPAASPQDSYLYNAWGYFKGAATLDALRLFVGASAFEAGLRRYLDVCVSPAACGMPEFQRAIEGSAVGSLDKFFAQWIRGSASPRVSVKFVSNGDSSIKVTLDQLQASPAYVPLELWLTTASGVRRREAVVLETAKRELDFASTEPIRSVQVNPRQQGLLQLQSAVDGDLDFDGAVDGLDLLECAWRLGRRTTAVGSPGSVFGSDLDFDPACDRDGDGVLNPADLTSLTARFPVLK